jgi:hypothetical protein
MSIDYTSLKACPKDPFALRRLGQVIYCTAECELLCFMDAYSGYHQIKMKAEDQEKTSFITPYGAFCYMSMPSGPRATYMRCIQSCLQKQIGHNAHTYVNYIVIKSRIRDLILLPT